MPLVVKDRVKETTTTTGTGTYTLAGASTGFQSFSVIGNGNTTYYAVTDNVNWEVGIGTYTSSGTTLSRDSVLASSNGGNAVNWGAGTKDIFVTYPAERSITGPSTATDNAVVRFDTTDGTIVQNSGVTIDDSNNMTGVVALTTTGVVTVPAGTNTAPAITTAGDTNTGIYFPTADTIAFTEGGVESGRFTSTGALQLNNNLSFSGTGNRITGDFSNATLASRVMFQTSTANSSTFVGHLPNGTAQASGAFYYAGSDPANTSALQVRAGLDNNQIYLASVATGTGTYLPMAFYTNGSERMRIDTSGNVGIGTSSPAARLNVQVTGNGDFTSLLLSRTTGSINQEQSIVWQQNDLSNLAGAAIAGSFESATSGSLRFKTTLASSLTERMRIDSSGNLLVGTTDASGSTLTVSTTDGAAPANGTGSNALRLRSTASAAVGAGPSLLFEGQTGNTTAQYGFAAIQGFKGSSGANDYSGVLAFYTQNSGGSAALTERMRITEAGNLLLGTTSSAEGSGVGLKLFQSATGPRYAVVGSDSSNTTIAIGVYSTGAAAYRFQVGYGGTIYATSTSISAISDQTLKENIRDLETGLFEVMSLKPRRFDWINGDAKNVAGFVAQEVEQVLPELVEDYIYNKDDEGNSIIKKSLKMGDILPTLVKAIQEQQALIEQLTQRIAALEQA